MFQPRRGILLGQFEVAKDGQRIFGVCEPGGGADQQEDVEVRWSIVIIVVIVN
jgi:hypothetical protein